MESKRFYKSLSNGQTAMICFSPLTYYSMNKNCYIVVAHIYDGEEPTFMDMDKTTGECGLEGLRFFKDKMLEFINEHPECFLEVSAYNPKRARAYRWLKRLGFVELVINTEHEDDYEIMYIKGGAKYEKKIGEIVEGLRQRYCIQ